MSVLVITDLEVLTLSRLAAADTVAAADVAAVKSYEQGAQESRLLPSALATAALGPLLRRGVAKLIAAEVLEMRARDGSLAGFSDSGIVIKDPPRDYSLRLRQAAEEELGPYLILAPGTAKDAATVVHLTAESAKITAETTLIPVAGAASVAKLGADASHVAAQTSKIAVDSANVAAVTGRVGDERGRLVADALKLKSEAVLAQLSAGIISIGESRVLLGLIGAAPVALSLSSGELDARRRVVKDFTDRGLLVGDEVGLSVWLGLPAGVTLVHPTAGVSVTPGVTSGASHAAQTDLYGRSEADRFGAARGGGYGGDDNSGFGEGR